MQVRLYGLIIAVAAVSALLLIESLVKRLKLDSDLYWELVGVALVGGMTGARAYHVATDWRLYAQNWVEALYIWTGGLSIIGAVLGGVIATWLYARWRQIPYKKLLPFLDLSVFGLPVAQAIGRWGNYFNQELYGLPTDLPWAIKIDPSHRLPGFEQFAFYHPLFAYEQIFLLLFAGVVWWQLGWPSQINSLREKVGGGYLFLIYVAYYSAIRFGLDFIRIDKAELAWAGIGVNQLVLAGIFAAVVAWLYRQRKEWW